MSPDSNIQLIYDHAPDVHLLRIQPNDKMPVKGSRWRNNKLPAEDAVSWLEAGHRLGIVPASANAAVADIDNGGEESLNIAKSTLGDPVAIVETGSHAPDNPRWHLIYSHNPADKIGNAKWVGGDLRVDAGYVVIWDLDKWAEAIAKIAIQAIPPAPIAKLKTAQPPADSAVVGFQCTDGLHPRALEEIGRAIRESATWDECVKRCDAIVKEHAERRRARDGDNPKTDAKLKSEMDAWNKAIPQWWAEKQAKAATHAPPKPDDSDYKLLDQPFVSSYGMGSPGKLLKEACAALGIRFRTNITRNIQEMRIEGYTLDRNGDTIWTPIEDGLDSTLALILEWNVRYVNKKDEIVPVNFASTNAKLKDYIAAELHRNQHHPFREYLESLPDWDGCGRIDRLLDFLGLKIDIDPAFEKWAHTYMVIEPIRLNLFPGSERKTHLVLSGGTNSGKSQLGKRLFPTHLATADYQNEGFVFSADKTDQMYQVLGYILCEGSEFTGGDIQSIRQAKAFLSQPGFAGGRIRYKARAATGYRTDCIYFTTNDKAPLPPDDPAMDGRLIMAIVNGQCEHDGKNAFPILDMQANPENPAHGTIRDQIWAEAYHVVLDAIQTNTVLRNPFLPPHELATKAQEWNAYVGAHYSTEMTVRREQMQTAIDELGNPSKIEFESLIEEMYRAETGEPVVKVGDRADFAFENFKRQHPKHKVINGMSMLGYRWVKGRWEGKTKWLFHNGNRSQ